jgi:hypothetical protein
MHQSERQVASFFAGIFLLNGKIVADRTSRRFDRGDSGPHIPGKPIAPAADGLERDALGSALGPVVPNHVVRHAAVRKVGQEHANRAAVEDGVPGDMHSSAIHERQSRAAVLHVVQLQPADRAVAAVLEDDIIPGFVGIAVHRIAFHQVRPEHDLRRVFNQQVVGESLPKGIAGDGHAAGSRQMDVGLDVGEDVVADGDVAAVDFLLLLGERGA